MAVKLDMSKAYDRVEWDFLKAIMERMGFCHKWIQWVTACISSVTYSFNINGEQKEFITPSRGIRQDDPLSPYLFLMCSEGLSNLLQKAKVGKELTGIKISRGAPAITHLFFADDSLVFCKANRPEAGKLMKILKVYEKATGQQINTDKSSVFFSKNTTQLVREEVCHTMGSIQQIGQGQYLGLPMIITKSKEQVFGFIKNSIDKKLQGWKNKLLSQAGKEVMLKAVAMAMPIYTMSCFKLSTKLCRDISAKMADYWWGESEGRKRMHWIGWKKLSDRRSSGGMGFKDLQIFNRALLAKQVWKLLTQPNLLVSRVLKEKYYPRQSLFSSKVPQNASWIWQSLAAVREEVQNGVKRKIGNGKGTRIWEDDWIPESPDGKPTTGRPLGCQLQHVSDLITHNRWNAILIFRIFNQQDAERILKIPISLTGKVDSHYWMHSQNGQYTAQSGYKMWKKEKELESARRREDAGPSYEGNIRRVWKTLWQQKKARNEREFNQKEREPHKIIQKAMKEWMEFDEANKGKVNRKNTQRTEVQKCTEQLQGQREIQASLMIKVHTHQDARQKMVGIGVSATDSLGRLQACWAMRERMSAEPIQDQAGAVRLALLNAISQGWRNIRVELENRVLVECIKNTRTSYHLMATLIEDIQCISNLFQNCSFSFVSSGFVGCIKLSMHALNICVDEEWVNPNLRC
ncbi:uncharacterized protein LOC113755222 [Coffea eugenioides]|uniref:uncharacterized protein LOC113755222 n=1 Tax=Coffea eugenioides TaxID=49369 RepID=UPI000F60E76C|nr:uncharacterized protein LOC113755222 [Coffea eugenioides]